MSSQTMIRILAPPLRQQEYRSICARRGILIYKTVRAIRSHVAAVVISYGKNTDEPGNPSSPSETENQDPDNILVQKEYATGDASDEFDDLLIWIPTNNLIYRMVQAERLP